MIKNKQVAFIRLGCDKNEVDADIMTGLLLEQGFSLATDVEQAEVIIVNSCGFIQAAKEESIEYILQAVEYKKIGIAQYVLVTGCLAQRYGDELAAMIPEVDAFVGTGNIDDIVKVLNEVMESRQTVKLLGRPKLSRMFAKRNIDALGATAYVKIAEGCNSGCTYCIIPQLRGKYLSRTIESIYNEVVALAEQGVKEVILVAQDTTFYGYDLYGQPSLVPLLQKLLQVKDIVWFRLLYCYPTHITDDLLDLMAAEPRIVNYLDIPLQHANAEVLRRMRRPGIDKVNVAWLAKIRQKVPGVTLRTTMIVGFPGETEASFAELVEFINAVGFDHLGVFQYSQEEGTIAAAMADQVEDNLKRERAVQLMEEQRLISWQRNQRYIGQIVLVLLEKQVEDGLWVGRSEKDAPEIDGLCYVEVKQPVKAGDFVKVQIEEAYEYDLKGCMVNSEQSCQ